MGLYGPSRRLPRRVAATPLPRGGSARIRNECLSAHWPVWGNRIALVLYTLKRRFARSYSIYAINLECRCPFSPPIAHTAFHNVLAANEAAHLLKSLSDDYRALFGPPRVSLRHRAKRVHPNPNHRGCPPVPPTNGCRLGGWHLGHSPCNGCLRPAAAKPSSE